VTGVSVPTADELVALCRRLLDEWIGPADLRVKQREVDRLAIVVTLAHHVHRLAEACLLLDGAGLSFQSMPLVRAAYESGLRAQWVDLIDDAPAAFNSEDDRQAEALYESALSSGWISDPDLIAALDAREVATEPAVSSARRVDLMCDDLEGAGRSAYTLYRAMSQYCHPGRHVAERYLIMNGDEWNGFRDRPDPDLWDRRMALHPLGLALVFVGRAVDRADPTRARRTSLRDAGRALEIPEHLRVSDAAWIRTHAPKPRT
jgi:hypothetical protein